MMKTMLSVMLGMAVACGVAMGEPEGADAAKLDAGAKFILGKLEGKVIPEVKFEGATLKEASGEVGTKGGVSFLLKGSEEEVAKAGRVTYAGKNVRVLDAVAEVARQCGRDAYVTSSGILLTGEGAEVQGEVWKVVRVKVADDAKALLGKVRMPVVDFDDTSVEEAVDFLRVRVAEVEAGPVEKKGISFIERKRRGEVGEKVPGIAMGEEELSVLPRLRYEARDVTFGEVLKEVARQAKLDVYLTTGGLLLRPAGKEAFATEKERAASLVEVIYTWGR